MTGKTTETFKTVFLWVWFLILAVVAGLAFQDGPVESLPWLSWIIIELILVGISLIVVFRKDIQKVFGIIFRGRS